MTVLVAGAFDLGHWGHLRFLNQAKTLGDVTVALSDDRFIEETKGQPPVLTYFDRRKFLNEAGCYVVPRLHTDILPLVRKVEPDWFACGSDWIGTTHLNDMGLTVAELNSRNIRVVYFPRDHDMSSTRIREAL